MRKLIINGGKQLEGDLVISGSKNVVLKALVAACLTSEPVTITNVPMISDFYSMCDLLSYIGVEVEKSEHKVVIRALKIEKNTFPLDMGAKIRTSSMLLVPILVRCGEARVPNPGGCRIGARPIDRHIKGLRGLGATIEYNSSDGYFYASTSGLRGTSYVFEKNTHTGTETLILAAVLAQGITVLENAASEVEVDDLIKLLNSMGANIRRVGRKITIKGVERLHGTEFRVMPDRNEAVTFAIASALTGGKIKLLNAEIRNISTFIKRFEESGGEWVEKEAGVIFRIKNGIKPSNVITEPHPGFMTDWQGPWAILMTQAQGESTIHEGVYENRFGYVSELKKMGAQIEFYDPKMPDPKNFYNFNYDPSEHYDHAIRITGPVKLHNAVTTISDLRAGATVLLAALIASGQSILYGVEHLDRGYEDIEGRLKNIGASITVQEENI